MIRRLITHGCSFTYGQELADPKTCSWPALLANKLNLELVNLAQPAYANDLILQDIVSESINPKVGTPGERMAWDYHDLVIIGWSSHLRLGFIDEAGWYSIRPSAPDNRGYRQDINKLLMTTLDTEWLYDRWLQQVILAQEYLRNRYAHYLMFSAFDNLSHIKRKHKLHEKIIKRNFLGWPNEQMTDWTYKCPVGPEQHPLEQGHEIVAEKIFAKLQDLYGLGT